MTLSSPLVAPLKHPIVSRLILFGGLAIALMIFFLPDDVRVRFDVPFYIVICIVLAWGFAAALHTWYIATTEAERERARAFTLAFGARDLLWTITFGYYTAAFYGLIGPGIKALEANSIVYNILLPLFYELTVIIYVPLVAYGVLRVQLFDIDLRIKRTLKRGTVAAAFVATFFVVSELAGNYLSSQFGTVLGVLGTGTLVSQGLVTVQPVLTNSTQNSQFTHVTGAAPLPSEKNVIYGDRKFKKAAGSVRLSGLVNLSKLPTDGMIDFDCVFIIDTWN